MHLAWIKIHVLFFFPLSPLTFHFFSSHTFIHPSRTTPLPKPLRNGQWEKQVSGLLLELYGLCVCVWRRWALKWSSSLSRASLLSVPGCNLTCVLCLLCRSRLQPGFPAALCWIQLHSARPLVHRGHGPEVLVSDWRLQDEILVGTKCVLTERAGKATLRKNGPVQFLPKVASVFGSSIKIVHVPHMLISSMALIGISEWWGYAGNQCEMRLNSSTDKTKSNLFSISESLTQLYFC